MMRLKVVVGLSAVLMLVGLSGLANATSVSVVPTPGSSGIVSGSGTPVATLGNLGVGILFDQFEVTIAGDAGTVQVDSINDTFGNGIGLGIESIMIATIMPIGGAAMALTDGVIANLMPGSYILSIAAAPGFGSAGFAGYTAQLTAVPLPAAAWLFISALGGMFVVGRRRRLTGAAA